MGEPAPVSERVRALRRASTVRATARRLLELARRGALADWRLDETRLPELADAVAALVRERFPDGAVPIHGRFRHLDAGGVPRLGRVARGSDRIDLVVVSVLLDAGAGSGWRYRERETGGEYARSEGLAVASVRMFEAGLFGEGRPAVSGRGLASLTEASLAEGLQASETNPIAGLAGRLDVLHRLGAILGDRRANELFARVVGAPAPRLHDVLDVLLSELSPMFPGRLTVDGAALGDVWEHPALPGEHVPFHKLSQWLAYSLVEPLAEAGCHLAGLDELTGLAEYRNGGLFVDGGVLTPIDPAARSVAHPVASPLVVGWRALTVALLDELHPLVAARLGESPAAFSLPKLLEGGTWLLGRRLAERARPPGGEPPIRVVSDGTVF